MDEMTVQVEARPECWGTASDEQGRQLAFEIKELVGVTAKVEVVAPGAIERSLGKAKRVIDKRVL